jgi:hypothetical protein
MRPKDQALTVGCSVLAASHRVSTITPAGPMQRWARFTWGCRVSVAAAARTPLNRHSRPPAATAAACVILFFGLAFWGLLGRNAEFNFRGSFFENAVLRAAQGPMACVRWERHGIGRSYARGVLVRRLGC